jgi:threonine dehydrogenase-like Zn-dependent dehydrogenase
MSGVGKALRVADEVQQRLRIWQPRRAVVTGAGTIGLLATLVLRQRGLDVTCWSRRPAPYASSELVERMGARYVSAADRDLAGTAAEHGPFDIVFEGSGAAAVIFPAAATVATNGVLVLFSLTPGRQLIEVDVGSFNQAFVLDNKALVGSVTASIEDYAQAVADLGRAEVDGLPRHPSGDAHAAHRRPGPRRHPPAAGGWRQWHQGRCRARTPRLTTRTELPYRTSTG